MSITIRHMATGFPIIKEMALPVILQVAPPEATIFLSVINARAVRPGTIRFTLLVENRAGF
jgi:hypothetical protein